MTSNSLCLFLVLNTPRVVETQIQASLAMKMKTVDGLQRELKKDLALFYKIEHTSRDPQPCLQMTSNSLCQFLVLNIHRVVETQI